MVVLRKDVRDKGYRRFRIRLDTGGQRRRNDVGGLAQAILGRANGRWAVRLPTGLVIVDGGKPQLNVALGVLSELGLGDIPAVGLAKREEELFVAWSNTPVVLPNGSASLYLVKRVRDEAHRFAIEYHRQLRGRAATASVLDEVSGVGPKRKRHCWAFRQRKGLRRPALTRSQPSAGYRARSRGDPPL
jgi:excinuclease ABC subunit C